MHLSEFNSILRSSKILLEFFVGASLHTPLDLDNKMLSFATAAYLFYNWQGHFCWNCLCTCTYSLYTIAQRTRVPGVQTLSANIGTVKVY